METGNLKKWMVTALSAWLVLGCYTSLKADAELTARRPMYVNHIYMHFAEQLTNPEAKKRKCFSQFGYGLYLVNLPLFPITDFMKPGHYGQHSYGKPSRKEHNGALYTCNGGFIDFSHVRCAADWTVYLTFKIITQEQGFDLDPAAAQMHITLQNVDQLSLDDIASMAQRIAFERLQWHEVASWYHHYPNHTISEQQSTFTPEDVYSNLLGTVIGKNIALRILEDMDGRPYQEIADEEIEKAIAALNPVAGVKETKKAYDLVDYNKQVKLPEAERNNDVWWDSKVAFADPRYVFKRNMQSGPQLQPWLVPMAEKAGCTTQGKGQVLDVPQKSSAGISFNHYYEFKIIPDSSMFFAERTGRQIHNPIAPFTTAEFGPVMKQVSGEMEKKLLTGFEKRNSRNPVKSFRHLHLIFFK